MRNVIPLKAESARNEIYLTENHQLEMVTVKNSPVRNKKKKLKNNYSGMEQGALEVTKFSCLWTFKYVQMINDYIYLCCHCSIGHRLGTLAAGSVYDSAHLLLPAV